MPRVVLKENEVLDDALRRFKRQVSRNGTLADWPAGMIIQSSVLAAEDLRKKN